MKPTYRYSWKLKKWISPFDRDLATLDQSIKNSYDKRLRHKIGCSNLSYMPPGSVLQMQIIHGLHRPKISLFGKAKTFINNHLKTE